MKFVLIVILSVAGGHELSRTAVKDFAALDTCRIYVTNHPELSGPVAGKSHPPKYRQPVCVPAASVKP